MMLDKTTTTLGHLVPASVGRQIESGRSFSHQASQRFVTSDGRRSLFRVQVLTL